MELFGIFTEEFVKMYKMNNRMQVKPNLFDYKNSAKEKCKNKKIFAVQN